MLQGIADTNDHWSYKIKLFVFKPSLLEVREERCPFKPQDNVEVDEVCIGQNKAESLLP